MANETKPELIAIYQKTAGEITRYRDFEWKITIWALSLLVGIISFTKLIPVPSNHKPIIQTLFVVFIVVAIPFSIWHILYCHHQLTKNRQVHRKCEKELQIDNFLPEEWKKEPEEIKYTKGLWHLASWIILILLATGFAIYSICLW